MFGIRKKDPVVEKAKRDAELARRRKEIEDFEKMNAGIEEGIRIMEKRDPNNPNIPKMRKYLASLRKDVEWLKKIEYW